MQKFIAVLADVKTIAVKLSKALLGIIAVICLVDILLPKVSFGVLSSVISTIKSLIATGTGIGLSGLIVLAIVVIALKK